MLAKKAREKKKSQVESLRLEIEALRKENLALKQNMKEVLQYRNMPEGTRSVSLDSTDHSSIASTALSSLPKANTPPVAASSSSSSPTLYPSSGSSLTARLSSPFVKPMDIAEPTTQEVFYFLSPQTLFL